MSCLGVGWRARRDSNPRPKRFDLPRDVASSARARSAPDPCRCRSRASGAALTGSMPVSCHQARKGRVSETSPKMPALHRQSHLANVRNSTASMHCRQTRVPGVNSSCQRDHFLKTSGNQYRPQSQASHNLSIWHGPAVRSALPPGRPPLHIPLVAPCVALRLPHRQPAEKKLPPPSRPST